MQVDSSGSHAFLFCAWPDVHALQVCPMEDRWVAPILDRLQSVDVRRLSGGRSAVTKSAEAFAEAASEQALQQPVRRNDDDRVAAARERFLARKKARLG